MNARIGGRNDQPDISALEECNLPLNHAGNVTRFRWPVSRVTAHVRLSRSEKTMGSACIDVSVQEL